MTIQAYGGIAVTGGDVTAKNTSIIDIPAGAGVVLDVAFPPSGDAPVSVTVPLAAGSVAKPWGIAATVIKVGKTGLVRRAGAYQMVASGAITYGDFVQIDSTAAHMGQAKTKGAGVSQLGQAMNSAADAESVLVWVDIAANV
jgi:hypothetical protein